jgi:hypothetical protein
MNSRKVVIENAFDFFQNKWKILNTLTLKLIKHHQLQFFVVYFTTIVKCGVHQNLDSQMQKKR